MNKKSLFNEYEAYSSDGKTVSWAFREITSNWLINLSNEFSPRELELICIDELTSIMAEIRIKKSLDTKRTKLRGN